MMQDIELRFEKRHTGQEDGHRVYTNMLQWRKQVCTETPSGDLIEWTPWQDVPLVKEELYHGIRI